jgi:chromate reductase
MQGNERPVRVLGIAGSLRRKSYNRSLLAAAAELAPTSMSIETFDLADVPLYNGDLDTDEARPEPVRRLRDAVAAADAVLIASPEYNHSVPGVLQNALDWASRPGGRSPFAGKPVAIMGTSPGPVGTARGQQVLKLVVLSLLAHLIPHPGVVVNMAGEKFDADGRLVHEPTRAFLATFLAELEAWGRRMR